MYLLCYHGENFKLNPIELIEARPSPSTSQSLEELPHGQVVQSVRAVEHHALYSQRLGQVFHRLRLARTRRTFRRPIQVESERANQCTVATISERSYHQSSGMSP